MNKYGIVNTYGACNDASNWGIRQLGKNTTRIRCVTIHGDRDGGWSIGQGVDSFRVAKGYGGRRVWGRGCSMVNWGAGTLRVRGGCIVGAFNGDCYRGQRCGG